MNNFDIKTIETIVKSGKDEKINPDILGHMTLNTIKKLVKKATMSECIMSD